MADGDKNEVLVHEWVTLKTLWDQCCPKNPNDPLQDELTNYFKTKPKSFGDSDWNDLNRAEQLVGMYLSADRIKFEYDNLLSLAEARNLPTLTTFKCYKVEYFGSAGTEPDRRWAYQSLLYSLQSAFVEGRFERELKKVTARRLLTRAVELIGVTAVLHYAMMGTPGVVDPLTLTIVAAMGVVGAFFSRVATFQTSFSTLRFSDITNSYQKWVLLVRLAYGCIGAIIFCYLMRSGLLSSLVLPDAHFWERPYGPSLPAGAPDKLNMVTEWSKLLVWSFIAGFSERFVSGSLDKISSK